MSDPADYIGDDAQPALTIANQSTGPGLAARGFVSVSAASIDQLNLVGRGAGNIFRCAPAPA